MLALGQEDLKGSVFGPFAYVKKGAGFPVIFQVAPCYTWKRLQKRKEDFKREISETF
jgi:hypothetical protein